MLINDVIKEFVFEIRLRNYSERTIKGYQNNLFRFAKYVEGEFELAELEDINHIHMKSYLNYLKSQKRSEVYINTILKNLRSFYKYCNEEEYCLNWGLKVGWLRENKTFSDEIRRMMDVYTYSTYIGARNKCIMAVLIDTGIRNFKL